MTSLPAPSKKKLGLVIDLDTCVGCHACAVACKEWNAGGIAWAVDRRESLRRRPVRRLVQSRPQLRSRGRPPRSRRPRCISRAACLHCETPACVSVCPTGASYKRAEDGIVLVDEDKCIGCKLCSWACPYGAREYSEVEGVMKKCTLCVDRIYNENIPEQSRQPACVQACPTRARHFGDPRR
jgi:Fe-S-cluster-containing dehydrogenase component